MNKQLDFIRETFRGKTISRILFNRKVHELCRDLSGNVIDLAGGYHASYYRYLPQAGFRLIRTDIKEGQNIELILDLNNPFPIEDAAYDSALFFNALYILEDSLKTLREVRRILKPGGKLYFSTPFISSEIPEPHDYIRYTREGLEKLFQESEMEIVRIESYGDRFTSAVYLLHPFFAFNFIRLVANACALALSKFFGARMKGAAPIGYFCVCQRPNERIKVYENL